MYHFHTSDQRKASAYISHIALTQNVNEIICTATSVYISLRQCVFIIITGLVAHEVYHSEVKKDTSSYHTTYCTHNTHYINNFVVSL